MLNQIIIVGRVVQNLEIKITDDNKKVAELIVAVQREFKNMEGTYDTDFIKCTVWDHLAESVATYCKKGNMVAVRGRLQIKKITVQDIKINALELIAMRIHYLSAHKSDPQDEGSL